MAQPEAKLLTPEEKQQQATEVEAPKGTALILAIYAALISILWGAMYFEVIFRSPT